MQKFKRAKVPIRGIYLGIQITLSTKHKVGGGVAAGCVSNGPVTNIVASGFLDGVGASCPADGATWFPA